MASTYDLFLCVRIGTADQLRHMINGRVDINSKDGILNNTLAHIAVQSGKIENLRVLFEAGVDLDVVNKNGETPLYFAAKGKPDCLQFLLEHGANPNSKNNIENTPLHSSYEYPKCTEILLRYGSEINAKNINGSTVLHLVAESGNKENAQILLNYGANIEIKDIDEETARSIATRYGHTSIMKLIDNHKFINVKGIRKSNRL